MASGCPTLSRMEEGGAKAASAEDLQAEQDRRALHLMLEYVCTATRADGSAVALNQGSAHAMQASFRTTPPPDGAPDPAAAMRAECLRTGAVVDCADTASDARGIVDAEACGQMKIAAVVAAPVCVDGRTVGVLEMHSAQAYNFMEGDVEVLKRVADVIGALVCRRNSI
ncbi:MAG: GAF domain-containing protein [Terriglobales bacterium]